ADTLDEVRAAGAARVDRTRRVGADDLHRRVAGLERAADARDRAARTDPGHEVRDPPAGLAPDLRSRRLFVRLRVSGVRVLIRPERAGGLAHEALRGRVVGARVLGRDRG